MLERLYSKKFKFHLYLIMKFFTKHGNTSNPYHPKPLKNETTTVIIARHGFEVEQGDSTITKMLENFVNE